MNKSFSIAALSRRARRLWRGEDLTSAVGGVARTEEEVLALEVAMRLPERVWRRLDRVERARVRATLARILSTVGERGALVDEVARAVSAFLSAHASGAASLPVVFAVGPVGGRTFFALSRVDLDRLAKAAPEVAEDFLAALGAFGAAGPLVRRELLGEVLGVATDLALAASGRVRPTEQESERAARLRAALEGREPAATTDTELAVSLCRAYLGGILRAGDEASFEEIAESRAHV